MSLDNYDRKLVERAAPKILGPRPDGKPWTCESVFRHAFEEFDFVGQQQFEAKLDRFALDEQRAQAEARAHVQADPVLSAQETLASLEQTLSRVRGPLSIMQRDLAEHDAAIAALERRRKVVKTKQGAWLECSQELQLLAFEKDRLELLVKDQQAEIDKYTDYVARARADLEAKQQAAKQQAATQQQAADTAAA